MYNTNGKKISLSSIGCFLLCIYLATNALTYIDFLPKNINSISFRVFIVFGVISVFSSKLIIGKILKWYTIFIVISAISLLYTAAKTSGISILIGMLKILIFIALIVNVVNSKKKIQWVFFSQSISTFLLFINLLLTGQLATDGVRLGQELTGNANTFASIFMLGSMSTVYFIIYFKNKICWVIIFVCIEIALALSGGRKFFVLPIILLLVTYMMNGQKRKRTVRFICAAILFCALIYLVMNVSFLYDAIGYRFDSLFSGLQGGTYDASAKARIDMIDKAIQLWGNSPIWGNGIDSFQVLSGYGCYSHNNFVELLCNLGVIGFIAYYSYYIIMIREFRKHISKVRYFFLVMGLCLLAFDYGAVSYYMFSVLAMLTIILQGMKYCDDADA